MNNLTLPQLRADALRILRAAVDAVDPGPLVQRALADLTPRNLPTHVVAAGKAAAGMLRGAMPQIRIEAGVVASHDELFRLKAEPTSLRLEMFVAGHPTANAASVAAGERALAIAEQSRARGGLLVLLSGGASAMLVSPSEGIELAAKQETAGLLMRAGAAIDELNCVRKHLSRIKGGRLAAAAGRTVTLALSDVHAPVADDPSVIGSGPTVADPTTFADANEIVRRYGIDAPDGVKRHLAAGANGEAQESVKPGDPRIASAEYAIVGNRHTAVAGARAAALAAGYEVVVLPEVIAGEARDAARAFVTDALRTSAARSRPLCVLGSGETTVTVRGRGVGGRNLEFVLTAALAIAEHGRDLVVASAGTDGIDGPTTAAGAVADTGTVRRARSAGLDPLAALEANDSFPFFAGLEDLIVWGPTGTNVGDVQLMLVS